jgi:predicted methyltransferase
MKNLSPLFYLSVFSLTLTAACSSKPCHCDSKEPAKVEQSVNLPKTIEEAADSPLRSEANRARDRYRHPVDTLRFFGLKPDMTVVEIAPGSGWYYEILAPLLAEKGHYIAASGGRHDTFLTDTPIPDEAKSRIQVVSFNPGEDSKKSLEVGAPESADLVVTFRNIHNWMSKGAQKEAFVAFYHMLKPGGILGVVEHRANPKSKYDPKAKSGYVREADVIKWAEAAGFKLTGQSEINSNPKDTKNYPQGVWTLPPNFKLGEKNHAHYAEIGESDRMTLRFIKPAQRP